MFQDLRVRYDNAFRSIRPEDDSVALIRREEGLLARYGSRGLEFPVFSELPEPLRARCWRYAFTLGGTPYFLLAEAGDLELSWPEGDFIPSRVYRGFEPPEAVFAAAVSESLWRWYRSARFCGACGAPMRDSGVERARVCPECGLTVYPKIAPAIIAAVTDGDRLLLTKYRGRAFKRFALVAGFNEIGESIEDTVRREVLEETGLRVKNLRFYKSQPWVFTDSLLLGFWCELDGSDAITLEQKELSEAAWYRRDEIPDDYNPISLTGEMIGRFRSGADRQSAGEGTKD